METLRQSFNKWLAMSGYVGLVLLAIPVMAVLVFVLRVALLVALIVAAAVGVVLWLVSARFRAWVDTWSESDATYKGLRLATDVAVHPGHAWSRSDGADLTVGADDLLATILGPIERVDLPASGQQVVRGDTLFRLRRGDRVIEVPAPVGGTVVDGNEALSGKPGLINADPFRRGWAVKLRGAPDRDGPALRRGHDARVWFRAEVDKLLATVLDDIATGPAMADGGMIACDLYERIDDNTWRKVTETLRGAES